MAVFGCASDRIERSQCRSRARAPFPSRWAARAFWASAALAAAGCSPRQITYSGLGAFEVSLAASHDDLAVAWYDTRDGNAEVYVRSLDADGHEAAAQNQKDGTHSGHSEKRVSYFRRGREFI